MNNTLRKHALIAGISLIIMALAAVFAYGYVHNLLIVPHNGGATMQNLQNASGLFTGEIATWLLILITDLLVAWSLYHYFKRVDATISLITGLIRGVYSAVLALAIYQLIAVYQTISTTGADQQVVMKLMTNFQQIWSFGLIIFGMHLVGLGYLAIKSKLVPKWLSWLLPFAGLFYTGINLAKAFTTNSTEIIEVLESSLAAPMALAEIGLAIWLLLKGRKHQIDE